MCFFHMHCHLHVYSIFYYLYSTKPKTASSTQPTSPQQPCFHNKNTIQNHIICSNRHHRFSTWNFHQSVHCMSVQNPVWLCRYQCSHIGKSPTRMYRIVPIIRKKSLLLLLAPQIITMEYMEFWMVVQHIFEGMVQNCFMVIQPYLWIQYLRTQWISSNMHPQQLETMRLSYPNIKFMKQSWQIHHGDSSI